MDTAVVLADTPIIHGRCGLFRDVATEHLGANHSNGRKSQQNSERDGKVLMREIMELSRSFVFKIEVKFKFNCI